MLDMAGLLEIASASSAWTMWWGRSATQGRRAEDAARAAARGRSRAGEYCDVAIVDGESVDQIASKAPTIRPPTKAPGIEPMPPRMAATSAFSPSVVAAP